MGTNGDDMNRLVLNDVRESLNEMGIENWNERDLLELTRDIEALDDSSDLAEYCDRSESVFGDLYLNYDDSSPVSSSEGSIPIQSPIRRHRKSRNNKEVDQSVMDDDDDEINIIRTERPDVAELIERAYDSMSRGYAFLGALDNYSFPTRSARESSTEDIPDVIEDKENTPECGNPAKTLPPVLHMEPKSKRKTDAHVSFVPEKRDPSLRAILHPEPGRAVLKHDPVTRIHVYKEMWKRYPTPEEKKRLDLKKKIRDLLIYKPEKYPSGQLFRNQKDWSPKPYLT